jgi:hypothetical protein
MAEDPNILLYLDMKIEDNVKEIKDYALRNKQLLRNFLEGFKIDNMAINDYITYHMLNNLENLENPNYTYWMDTGLTWSLWYNGLLKQLSEEQYKSITTGYFKFHYIIADKDILKFKIKNLFDFTTLLSEKINEKLAGYDFETKVKLVNIKDDGSLDYIYDATQLFKEPSCNIRLIIVPKSLGGARIKKHRYNKLNNIQHRQNQQPQGTYGMMARVFEKINMDEFIIIESDFDKLKEANFNNKIILDFHLDYFYKTQKRELNISNYKEYYLLRIGGNRTYEHGDHKKLHNREKLNRLNETGMITYCLLNLSAIDDEFGINVDKYRQTLFLDNKKKEDIPHFFENLLVKYEELFSKFKSYNAFFIDKIKEIINFHRNKYFEGFKDFIDKWFVSKFRPYINSFIIEINKELFEDFKVILFIAGGDAMRRYKNDISFTKDIDTKLYIGSVSEDDCSIKIKDLINQERIKQRTHDIDVKLFIKDCVVGVITKHIVKLRNYLEQNINNIFSDILSYDRRDYDNGYGTKVLSFKTTNSIYYVDILLDSENNGFQQFRTRENKKRHDFPVDLYSIDYRTFIGEYDIDTKKLIGRKKAHDISILDVVLQDIDYFHPTYVNVFNDIPVASLKFLLEDFYKTYTTPDRALARISSGKVKKDIIRFNQIKDLYIKSLNPVEEDKQDNNGILIIDDLNKIIRNLLLHKDKFKKNVYNILLAFLIKIKNRKPIKLIDINAIISIYMDVVFQAFINKYPILSIAINDMVFFEKNIYNENLSKIEDTYSTYYEDDDPIRQGYYKLFSKLCSMENKDGLVRHVIMFSNSKILKAFNDIGIIQTIPKKIKDKKPKPKPKAVSQKASNKQVIKVAPPTRSIIKKSKNKNTPVPEPLPSPKISISKRGRPRKEINYIDGRRNKKLPTIQSSQDVNVSQSSLVIPIPQPVIESSSHPHVQQVQPQQTQLKRINSTRDINENKRRAIDQTTQGNLNLQTQKLKLKRKNTRLKFRDPPQQPTLQLLPQPLPPLPQEPLPPLPQEPPPQLPIDPQQSQKRNRSSSSSESNKIPKNLLLN